MIEHPVYDDRPFLAAPGWSAADLAQLATEIERVERHLMRLPEDLSEQIRRIGIAAAHGWRR